MTLTIRVEWSSAYELLVSFLAYSQRQHHSALDLGRMWVREVRENLGDEWTEDLWKHHAGQINRDFTVLLQLVGACPRRDTVDGFLDWLGALREAELYEMVAPFVGPAEADLLLNLGQRRTLWLAWLNRWNEQYFRHVHADVLGELHDAAEEITAMSGQMSPEQLVERATQGIRVQPSGREEQILLIPQFHFSPWNINEVYEDGAIHLFPVHLAPEHPGTPGTPLLRLTKALADESRLRILYYVAQGPKSFTDIVQYSGLSKGTVHHHLVALRAAGLVWVNFGAKGASDTYELNSTTVQTLSERLQAFLDGRQPQGGAR